MKIAFSKSHDPYINLATEETILKDTNIKEPIVYFYINKNTIVIGRNQNAHEEINSEFVKDKKINLIRRVSGGGAVYHDQGNINFSFIGEKKKASYSVFLEPIITFLKTLGLRAEFKGKNDVVIDGNKISGNAQYIWKDRMFHHGTLLFDTDLSILGKVLKPNKLKLKSKGIKSARQRVSNIRPLLSKDMKPQEFFSALVNYFKTNDIEEFNLDNYKQKEIEQLASIRRSYDWNYVKNPNFTIKNEKRFEGGTIKVGINVEQNKIRAIKFSGDFLSKTNTEEIEKHFIDLDFTDEVIKTKVLDIKDFDLYFGKITKANLISLIKGE